MAVRPGTIAKRQQCRTEHARKGGLATKVRYGREHYVRIGQLGGRPTFHESVAKAKERELEVQSRGVGPGRPRKAPPAGETKEMPAETAANRPGLEVWAWPFRWRVATSAFEPPHSFSTPPLPAGSAPRSRRARERHLTRPPQTDLSFPTMSVGNSLKRLKLHDR